MRLMRERDERDAHWRTWLLKRARQIVFIGAMLVFLAIAMLFSEKPESREMAATDCPIVLNVA